MPALEPEQIRNVAAVGHRGTGKTSLVEAMLFQAGATNRLGTVEGGSTVSDWDEDEQRRQMSLAASLCHLEWDGLKFNLIDTPGDAGFQGDAIASLRVVEGALIAVSGVMGVEVQTGRMWSRAEELGLSRILFVNMLDRERADFSRTLGQLQTQLSERCVAVHLPIGSEHELSGIVDLLHMKAYMSPEGEREGGPVEIPSEVADEVEDLHTKLLDSVVETDEALMERYLEGEELSPEEIATACGPKPSLSCSRVRKKSARSRSSMFTKIRRERPSSLARSHSRSVFTSTPITALRTTRAPSTTRSAARVSA